MRFPLPLLILLALAASLQADSPDSANEEPLRVAGLVTLYRQNSHADVILSRILKTETLDGQGRRPNLKLVSLYVDQVQENDLSRSLADEYGIRLFSTPGEALTLGTGKLAVDGVFLIAEHGEYPTSRTGQTIYPKRRLFTAVTDVFRESGRAVPVFHDKHLADTTADAQWYFQTAESLNVPLMAGTSITGTWREPPIDVERDSELTGLVVLSYGPLDAYGFHAVELLQTLAERRRGGETGVAAVHTLTGDAVWEAIQTGLIPAALVEAALVPQRHAKTTNVDELSKYVREPVAFHVRYRDGLQASVLTLNGAIADWSAAWTTREDSHPRSFRVDLQDESPYMHFGHLLRRIEPFLQTGEPPWPVDRTLFSSILLDAALASRADGGRTVETPELARSYRTTWQWRQPDDVGR